jgi:hypothetical protein
MRQPYLNAIASKLRHAESSTENFTYSSTLPWRFFVSGDALKSVKSPIKGPAVRSVQPADREPPTDRAGRAVASRD